MSLNAMNLILISLGVAVVLRLISNSKFANFVLAFTIAFSGYLLIRYHPEKMREGVRVTKATVHRVIGGNVFGATPPRTDNPADKAAGSAAKPAAEDLAAEKKPAAATVAEDAQK